MPLIFRDEQGFDLSADQVDGNFRFLRDLIQALIDDPPTAVGISNITVTGSQFTVWLSDGSFFGPFTLPIAAFHWREIYVADTVYFANDVFAEGGSVWLVLQTHLTPAEFDSGLENSDQPVYHQIFGPLEATMATVFTVATNTYTLQIEHIGGYIRFTHPDGCVLTAPPGYSSGDEWHIVQRALNPVSFIESGNAVINPYDGYMNQTGGRGRVVTLKNVGGDAYDKFGGLAEGDEYTT